MQLIYPPEADEYLYSKLGSNEDNERVWIFPDIKESFGVVEVYDMTIVDPSKYYVTSGEALRKTETLISDIMEAINEYQNNHSVIEDLTNMLLDIKEFFDLLNETKGSSLYLEVTKCEDGVFNGNICSRKDPKKKKKIK
jgi:hypothetical protein